MKKKQFGICLLFLCFSTFAYAQNKVVVIPLGSSYASSASGDAWIRAYDASDNFIGYVVYLQNGNDPPIGIVNEAGYFTGLWGNGGPITAGLYGASYTNDNCTGNPYVEANSNGPFYYGGRPGAVGRGGYEDTVYYIPLDASVVDLPAGTYYEKIGTSCNVQFLDRLSPWKAYVLFPNSPAVTGFENSYTGPLKAVYTLPAAP